MFGVIKYVNSIRKFVTTKSAKTLTGVIDPVKIGLLQLSSDWIRKIHILQVTTDWKYCQDYILRKKVDRISSVITSRH